MRLLLMVSVTLVAFVTGLGCSSNVSAEALELTARRQKILDDGEQVDVFIKATDRSGKVGAGTVTLETEAGTLGATTLSLDNYGTARTTFSCSVETDRACKGTVVLAATWGDQTAQLELRVSERCPGAVLCMGQCVVVSNNWRNCGACGKKCRTDEACLSGSCQPCPGGDCDSDGWTVSNGDCCDQFDACTKPASVNPGAVEVLGNNLDDNCNGLLDGADTVDVTPCDDSLGTRANDPMDLARAIGLCRSSTAGERTWGVLSTELKRVNGTGGVATNSVSIRPVFGTLPPIEGARMVVLSSGVASDAVQTNPTLRDGASSGVVSITDCATDAGGCIDDWFKAGRPPLKVPGQLPGAPNCGGSSSGQEKAHDSVMVRLLVRAPTNARSFKLRTRFFSEEFPEFVCSAFNDQMVLLIDTAGVPVGNPSDKNLMTVAVADAGSWPVGINLAVGTPLFQSCVSKEANPKCWDSSVSSASCGQGPAALALTQFSAFADGGCPKGGATTWMGTRGNVQPGAIFELRAAVWDVGDGALDSLVLMDGFEWGVDVVEPGTGE